jgi:hypothetical protein
VRRFVTLREILQKGPNSIRVKATAEKAIACLVEHGWLVKQDKPVEVEGQLLKGCFLVVRSVKL